MQLRFVLQPFEDDLCLYEALELALTDERFSHVTVVVAWAKEGGLRRIRPLLQDFRDRGGNTRILLGIDEGGATVEGLRAACDDFDEARVLFDSASGTFHPKLYIIRGESVATIIIGSNNLTPGGLFANYEAGTCLELDLADDADAEVYSVLAQYVARLQDDETSRSLTEELIEQLIADPRFEISSEDASRRGLGERDDSLGASRDPADRPRLFGRSLHNKKRDPAPRHTHTGAARPSPTVPVGGTSVEGGSTATVVARWSKQLSRSDSGRPRSGSQTTAALRFTKARQPIDQTRWFRERLFDGENWQPDPGWQGRDVAYPRFEVTINGTPRGTHELPIKHDAEREAGQHNFTTDLKWGSLTPVLRSEDLTGKWVTVEKLSDGALRLTVADAPTGEFIP